MNPPVDDSLQQSIVRAQRDRTVVNLANKLLATLLMTAVILASAVTPASAEQSSAITSRVAEINGVRIRYLVAGEGDPVLLLHGYAQTSHMWLPLIPDLARTHTVIAPDLRGFGDSARPAGG